MKNQLGHHGIVIKALEFRTEAKKEKFYRCFGQFKPIFIEVMPILA
jgi:hypothetical protein